MHGNYIHQTKTTFLLDPGIDAGCSTEHLAQRARSFQLSGYVSRCHRVNVQRTAGASRMHHRRVRAVLQKIHRQLAQIHRYDVLLLRGGATLRLIER